MSDAKHDDTRMKHDRLDDKKQPLSDQAKAATEAKSGAHEKGPDEAIKSRSADPGQSSYGGFANEDTSRQAQETKKG